MVFEDIKNKIKHRFDNEDEANYYTVKITKSKEKEYCPVCSGETIQMEDKSKVDMVLYGDVLTITDLSGVQVLGFCKIDCCPRCGRKLNKEDE